MSRIGKRILTIPENVEVAIREKTLFVKGPKGSLELKLNPTIDVKIKDQDNTKTITTTPKDDEKQTKQNHGTINSLINGMLIGVTQGFKKELEIFGVGYRVAVKGNKLNMLLGFSHDINLEIPSDLTITVVKNNQITVEGIDKQKVGQFAAQIRSFKKVEPYKGKGIKYKGEYVIRKVGKTTGK